MSPVDEYANELNGHGMDVDLINMATDDEECEQELRDIGEVVEADKHVDH